MSKINILLSRGPSRRWELKLSQRTMIYQKRDISIITTIIMEQRAERRVIRSQCPVSLRSAPASEPWIIVRDDSTSTILNKKKKLSSAKIEEKKKKNGWEFLFLAANIDAVQTAAQYGIGPDRAVDYHADSVGTSVVFDTVSMTVGQMRASQPIAADWSAPIKKDYLHRKKGQKENDQKKND